MISEMKSHMKKRILVFVIEHGLFSFDIINSSIVERSKTQPSIEFKLVQLISKSFPSHIKSFDFVSS